MSAVIAGEIGKMDILYEKYKRPLYAYFFTLTGGDKQSSEDLVHTVFYRIIKYRSSFGDQGSFVNWIFRIAHNAGIDHNRKIKHLNNYKNEILASQTGHYEQNEMEKDEKYLLLEYAMARLDKDERELLILGKIDCLRYKEIADILSITENNVKIRILRAVRKLRDIYAKFENTRYEKARS